MAFVTVKSLEGEPIEDVANDLFHAWGIGQKNKDNGVLFLLVIGDRRSRLEVGNGLEPILPDGAGRHAAGTDAPGVARRPVRRGTAHRRADHRLDHRER